VSDAPPRGLRVAAGDDSILVRCSTRADGDFSLEAPSVARAHRRAAFQMGAWSQLDEVHGTRVRMVSEPGMHDGSTGDALVCTVRGAALAIWVGDCAPLALVADGGVIGGCHAGWRGALDGVVEKTVEAMRAVGAAGPITAYLGPCIHGCCYEFGPDLLAGFVDRFGPQVAASTTWGTPSLHMPSVIEQAAVEVGVVVDHSLSECTACHPDRRFSHRRGDTARQVVTITRTAAA